MKRIAAILAPVFLLISILSLYGCDDAPPAESSPSTAPTVPETDPAPTLSTMDRYDLALQNLLAGPNLVIDYTSTEIRTVAGEVFSAKVDGSASYVGLSGSDPQALIREELTYGNYTATYSQSYIHGSAFSRLNSSNFSAALTIDQFLAQQLPLALLDRTLYSSVTESVSEDGSLVLTFEGASAPESWVSSGRSVVLTTAIGTATMDPSGRLTGFTYHAEYSAGPADYVLDITVKLESPSALSLAGEHPDYPETCVPVTDLRIPKHLMQTVGDIYNAQAMTITYTDTIHSQAFNQIRTQNNTINTFGTGTDFIAAIDSTVTVKDFSGIPTVNSQNVRFLNGTYSYSINGADAITDPSITADAVRKMCEDSTLAGLMTLSAITGAEVEHTGDFLCIRFTGSGDFAQSICSRIYSLFGMDLDAWATSHTTDIVSGYLTINQHTGLPTAMGISVKRTHVIDSVAYTLTYQVDQSLTIPGADAYENITGTPKDESVSPSTPLFYKVTGKDGKTMWLLGTVTVGDGRSNRLPQQILDAFAQADALAVSYDPDQFRQQLGSDSTLSSQLAEAYYYKDGDTTKKHLSAELYAQAQPLLLATGNNNINVPYMKVILWENMLVDLYERQSLSLTPNQSINRRLLQWAAAQSKPIYEIESGLTHLQLASHLSDELQSAMLETRMTLGLLGSNAADQALYDAWCQGDPEALLALLTPDETGMTDDQRLLLAEYRTIMHVKHNKALLKAAKTYLAGEETVFYAVDIAHLLGDDGLVAMLQDAGYTVETVTYAE